MSNLRERVHLKSHCVSLDEIDELIAMVLDEQAKDIATEFYYHWHNQPGTNTSAGFDDWWKLNKVRFCAKTNRSNNGKKNKMR